MDFLDSGYKDSKDLFLENFLTKNEQLLNIFNYGTDNELNILYSALITTPFKDFYNKILTIPTTNAIEAKDIPQFSSFRNGVQRIPELLEFAPEGLTFKKLGYQLNNCRTDLACEKYGENHAKLAEALCLVTVSKEVPHCVCSTNWGKFLLPFSFEEKSKIYQRMILREPVIQKLIQCGSDGMVDYALIVSKLSKSTIKRRRSNVRLLLTLALSDTGKEYVLNNINWKV